MSSVAEFACCVPILLLWLGPIALVAFCGLFGGCSKIAQHLRRPKLQP